MLKNRPAMKFVVPFIIGIIIGWNYTVPIVVIVLLSLILLTAYFFLARSSLWNGWSALVILIIIILMGMIKIVHDTKLLSDDNIVNYISPGRNITLCGTVSDLPRVGERSIRFVVEADSIIIADKSFKVSGGVAISAFKNEVDTNCLVSLKYGRRVSLVGELTTIRTARNPGEFDLKNYLNLNDIYASFYIKRLNHDNIKADQGENIFSLAVHQVRQSITKTIDRLFAGEVAQFLKGLLVGERSEIPLDVKTAFINSGVMHILAVSGLHVAIVTFIIFIVLQVIRIPEKVRIVLTCILLIYYNYLTGGAPSVTRSVIMAIVFLCAKLMERKNDMYNTLAFSAMILLLIDSRQLFQPGFQLSFAAVFSIVYLYPKIYNLKNLFPLMIRENRPLIAIFALLSVSVSAGVGTLPFSSIYFGKISIISFVANILIVPLSNVILALGMVAVAIAYISTGFASIYAELTSFLTWLLLRMVEFFGNLPFAYIESRLSIWSSLSFYVAVAILINIGRREVRKLCIILTLLLAVIWLYRSIIVQSQENILRLTFLDVGQGDAIFIEYPDGKNMLIDAGPKTFSADAGTRFIIPFLKYKSISRINTLILSHPDADHLGGVPTILRKFRVDQIMDAGLPCKSALCAEYTHLIDSLSLSRTMLHAGLKINLSEDLRFYILNPLHRSFSEGKPMSLNNRSVVMKVVYGETSILLTGDAEQKTEELLVSEYGNILKSNLLKVAHHGSITGTSVKYLSTVEPDLAVISVGANNKFHHPSPDVLQRLDATGCKYYRTDELGAVVMESDGVKWSVINWR